MKPPPELEVDVDFRLSGIWEIIWSSLLYVSLEPLRRKDLGEILRAGYMSGYRDAHAEIERGEQRKLYRDHNLTLT